MAKAKAAAVGSFNLGDAQSVPLSLLIEDAGGNPVPPGSLPSPPTWSVDNGALLTLTPSADGLSAVAAAVGPLGTATVSVSVPLASGAISGQLQIVIVAGPASQVVIVPGTPTP